MPSYENDIYLAIGTYPDKTRVVIDASVDGRGLLNSGRCLMWKANSKGGTLTLIKMRLNPDTFGIR